MRQQVGSFHEAPGHSFQPRKPNSRGFWRRPGRIFGSHDHLPGNWHPDGWLSKMWTVVELAFSCRFPN